MQTEFLSFFEFRGNSSRLPVAIVFLLLFGGQKYAAQTPLNEWSNHGTLRGQACFVGVSCDPPTALFLAIDPLAPATLYTTRYNGTGHSPLKSTNDGVTFSSFNKGFGDVFVNDLVFDRTGNFLYAATTSGVFSVRARGCSIRLCFRTRHDPERSRREKCHSNPFRFCWGSANRNDQHTRSLHI